MCGPVLTRAIYRGCSRPILTITTNDSKKLDVTAWLSPAVPETGTTMPFAVPWVSLAALGYPGCRGAHGSTHPPQAMKGSGEERAININELICTGRLINPPASQDSGTRGRRLTGHGGSLAASPHLAPCLGMGSPENRAAPPRAALLRTLAGSTASGQSAATAQGRSHLPQPSRGHQPAGGSGKMSTPEDEHLLQHTTNAADALGEGT